MNEHETNGARDVAREPSGSGGGESVVKPGAANCDAAGAGAADSCAADPGSPPPDSPDWLRALARELIDADVASHSVDDEWIVEVMRRIEGAG